jgi:glucose/arabinose dehydrogenase
MIPMRRPITSTSATVATLVLAAVLASGCGPSQTPSPSPASAGASIPTEAKPSPTAITATATPTPAAATAPSASLVPPPLALQTIATLPGGPLAIVNAGDGSGRLFVVTRAGQIRIVRDGKLVATPLLNIGGRITSGGERGLLGLAFDPGFPTSDQRFFVDYTDTNGNTVVSSFRVDPSTPDRADANSEQIVLRVTQPASNHNGGALAFGPDGFLYVSLGDGGGEGDPNGYGQATNTLLAKVLRIDVDHPASGKAYGIPAGNPFANSPGARPEIWLTGLRNPWRMSFDRATGNLWIGDVGQDAWEEVDLARGGAGGLNFGWSTMEGNHCYRPSAGCNKSGLTLPVTEYDHGQGCSVIGGYVYRGALIPALAGQYVFGDYCSGTIWTLDSRQAANATASPLKPRRAGSAASGLAAFGEDQAGELYAANVSTGEIAKVVAAN